MYRLVRPFLFMMDPEDAHERVILLLEQLQSIPPVLWLLRELYTVNSDRLRQELFGCTFPNPVGLAAGFDKDGRIPSILSALGFGSVEIGAVTARPQPGNSRPRMFRLPEDRALINRMGFNSEGADRVARRLRDRQCRVPLGINLGKTKRAEDPVEDYCYTFGRLHPHGDYFVINVSSPNTPGLRSLQERDSLLRIIQALQERNEPEKPLMVKISPDLTNGALDELIDVVVECDLDGIIAVNTTTKRANMSLKSNLKGQQGGLSGRPLEPRSTRLIAYLYQRLEESIPIIGVGGIFSAEDAYRKILAGASLLQLYTGLVYRGPSLVRDINLGLLKRLNRDGYSGIEEAVGQGADSIGDGIEESKQTG